MTSRLSFGNYQLLRRIACGEELRLLRQSILVTGQYVFAEVNPDSQYCTGIGVTTTGAKELRKEPPPFPRLGRGPRETECSRCGQPLQLCVGEAK